MALLTRFSAESGPSTSQARSLSISDLVEPFRAIAPYSNENDIENDLFISDNLDAESAGVLLDLVLATEDTEDDPSLSDADTDISLSDDLDEESTALLLSTIQGTVDFDDIDFDDIDFDDIDFESPAAVDLLTSIRATMATLVPITTQPFRFDEYFLEDPSFTQHPATLPFGHFTNDPANVPLTRAQRSAAADLAVERALDNFVDFEYPLNYGEELIPLEQHLRENLRPPRERRTRSEAVRATYPDGEDSWIDSEVLVRPRANTNWLRRTSVGRRDAPRALIPTNESIVRFMNFR